MKMSTLRRRKVRRSGFTLIELVMVIMILAIVSGLVVSIVGWLRRSANYGAQSHIAAGLSSNLELFRTTYGNNGYPDNLDSLILTGTTDPIYSGGSNTYMDDGYDNWFTVGNLDTDQRACLQWLTTVNDHDANKHAGLQGNPGNSAIHPRAFDGTNVAIINVGDPTATPPVAPPSADVQRVLNEIYPNGVPADVTLVAFGIGPSNEAVGRTMQAAPLDPRIDNSNLYGRFVGIWATYSPRAGRRAELKAVVNGLARTQNNALSEFWQSTTPE